MKTKITLILTIVCLIIVFFFGFFVGKGEKEVIEKVVTKTDTVIIHQPPKIIYKKAVVTKIVKDTVFVTNDSTYEIKGDDSLQVATADTSFNEGKLKVSYYFPPVNHFLFDWKPYPHKVITVTKEIRITPKYRWYQRKEVWFIGGLILGVYLGR